MERRDRDNNIFTKFLNDQSEAIFDSCPPIRKLEVRRKKVKVQKST